MVKVIPPAAAKSCCLVIVWLIFENYGRNYGISNMRIIWSVAMSSSQCRRKAKVSVLIAQDEMGQGRQHTQHSDKYGPGISGASVCQRCDSTNRCRARRMSHFGQRGSAEIFVSTLGGKPVLQTQHEQRYLGNRKV